MKHILYNVVVKSRSTWEEIGCIGVTASEILKFDSTMSPCLMSTFALEAAKKKFCRLFGTDNLDRFHFDVCEGR